jgi:uncharacterized membrane protein (UPF0127 family)
MIARIMAALAALALLGLSAVPASATETFRTEPLSIRTAAGSEYRFVVEMAETPKQMMQGLMYRTELAPDAGMLFVHEADRVATMWMKNTYIPLDMLFIDRTGRIAGIHERAQPRSLRTIAAPEPVRAVLELNGGTASRLGIRVGDRVVHPAFSSD